MYAIGRSYKAPPNLPAAARATYDQEEVDELSARFAIQLHLGGAARG